MKKQGGIKGHTNVVESSLVAGSQLGHSFSLSGRGHGRKNRVLDGSTNRAARRAAAADKRKGVK
tara:strand:+ start:7395 stop:7586 length:192 start_codon:yes stop_codon:yes gene_type:complete